MAPEIPEAWAIFKVAPDGIVKLPPDKTEVPKSKIDEAPTSKFTKFEIIYYNIYNIFFIIYLYIK